MCCYCIFKKKLLLFLTLSLFLSQKLKDVEPIIKIVEVDGQDLVKDYSDEIERMLGSKMKSVMVRIIKRRFFRTIPGRPN